MPTFKVGDVVTVRKDLNMDDRYLMDNSENWHSATYEMVDYAGEKVTIKYTGMEYQIVENENFFWTDEMFEEGIVKQKVRGFEQISIEQGLKDCAKYELFDVKLPKRGTKKSAGYDCFAPFDITLNPNEEINVPTGIKSYMQDGEVLMAFPRSGLGFKYYCRLANTVGIIDCDYYNNEKNEGHIYVKIRNEGDKLMEIKQGDGMCQFIFMPFLLADDDSFDNGIERHGGFGHTTGVQSNV